MQYYLPFVFIDNYWRNAHNRRNFFVEFALQKGFDPLVAVNWENIQNTEIIKQVRRKKHEGVEENRRGKDIYLKFKQGRVWPTGLL